MADDLNYWSRDSVCESEVLNLCADVRAASGLSLYIKFECQWLTQRDDPHGPRKSGPQADSLSELDFELRKKLKQMAQSFTRKDFKSTVSHTSLSGHPQGAILAYSTSGLAECHLPLIGMGLDIESCSRVKEQIVMRISKSETERLMLRNAVARKSLNSTVQQKLWSLAWVCKEAAFKAVSNCLKNSQDCPNPSLSSTPRVLSDIQLSEAHFTSTGELNCKAIYRNINVILRAKLVGDNTAIAVGLAHE